LQLNDGDRRLRFGTQTSDAVIQRYVGSLDFKKDAIFGIFDLNLMLIGMAHLAYLPEVEGEARAAEFGVSVLPEGRSQGFGAALLQRSAVHSRNTRIETLYVHCLTSNKAMMHLAQKAGMSIEYARGDADAYLKLPPANPSTIIEEAASSLYGDARWEGRSVIVQYVCFGSSTESDLQQVHPRLLQIGWFEVSQFLHQRHAHYPEKTPGGLVHEQWPDFGRAFGEWFTSHGRNMQPSAAVRATESYIRTGACRI
jgi:GNAT superfamily N-acetyltransferase